MQQDNRAAHSSVLTTDAAVKLNVKLMTSAALNVGIRSMSLVIQEYRVSACNTVCY